MGDASYVRDRHEIRQTAASAIALGEVRQMPDGRPGIAKFTAASNGSRISYATTGQFTIAKTTGQVWIDGAPLWWLQATNRATCVPPLTGKSFYLGAVVGDAAAADATGTVNLGVVPEYLIDIHRDGGSTAIVLTSGTPYLVNRGGTIVGAFSATNEAQKVDWLSRRSFLSDTPWILEALVVVTTNADADVADLTIGVANQTHASDPEAIGEFAVFRFNLGGDLNLYAASDDGTTDVAATDTTIDWAVGTPIHLAIDGRDPEGLKFHVNGVRVLSGTTFTLAEASGPLKALLHLVKSADDTPGVVELDMLRVRIRD